MLDHAGFAVQDYERSKAFYGEGYFTSTRIHPNDGAGRRGRGVRQRRGATIVMDRGSR